MAWYWWVFVYFSVATFFGAFLWQINIKANSGKDEWWVIGANVVLWPFCLSIIAGSIAGAFFVKLTKDEADG